MIAHTACQPAELATTLRLVVLAVSGTQFVRSGSTLLGSTSAVIVAPLVTLFRLLSLAGRVTSHDPASVVFTPDVDKPAPGSNQLDSISSWQPQETLMLVSVGCAAEDHDL